MRRLFWLVLLACGGCAVLSNVTPTGGGAWMAVVRSNDVNGRVEDQRDRALAQAAAFCSKRGEALEVVKLLAAPPPPGQPPSAEVDFRCQGDRRQAPPARPEVSGSANDRAGWGPQQQGEVAIGGGA